LSIPLFITSFYFYLPQLKANVIPICKSNLALLRVLFACACFYLFGIIVFVVVHFSQ